MAGVSECSSGILDALESVVNDVGISKGIIIGAAGITKDVTEDVTIRVRGVTGVTRITEGILTNVRCVVGLIQVTDSVTSTTKLPDVMWSVAGPLGCLDVIARVAGVLEGVTDEVRGVDDVGGGILMFVDDLRVSLGF